MADVIIFQRFWQRRDTAANWTSVNPTLAAGEFGYETDTGKLKIGDGTTAWNSLEYLPLLAADMPYDNTTSGLASDNVQDAIDELAGLGGGGGGATSVPIVASEAIGDGDFVSVWDDSGTQKVRKADATTTGKRADGYVKVGVSSGASASVYFDGINDALSGLTPGALLYLSTTAGSCTDDISGLLDGNVRQVLGRAISATSMAFTFDEPAEYVDA